MNILEVIGAHVQLARRGMSYVGMCPFHESGPSPAFHVNTDRGFFYCFECQAGGTAEAFLRLLLKHPEARRSIPRDLRVSTAATLLRRCTKFIREQPHDFGVGLERDVEAWLALEEGLPPPV